MQGSAGSVRLSIVAYMIRQAITLKSVRQRCNRAALSSWRASIRQPLLSTLCQTSIPNRHVYHSTHSCASATVGTGRVVSRSHSSGSTPAGGYSSTTWTAQTGTDGSRSARRWLGGHSSTAPKRRVSMAVRAGWSRGGALHRVKLRHRLRQDRSPQIPFLMRHPAVPRRADQEVYAYSSLRHKQIVHIGFPVPHPHPLRLRTLVPRLIHPRQTVHPFATFLRQIGRCRRVARCPTASGSRAHTACATRPSGTRSGVTASVLCTSRP